MDVSLNPESAVLEGAGAQQPKAETAEAAEEKKLSNHAQRHLEEKRKGTLRFYYHDRYSR